MATSDTPRPLTTFAGHVQSLEPWEKPPRRPLPGKRRSSFSRSCASSRSTASPLRSLRRMICRPREMPVLLRRLPRTGQTSPSRLPPLQRRLKAQLYRRQTVCKAYQWVPKGTKRAIGGRLPIFRPQMREENRKYTPKTRMRTRWRTSSEHSSLIWTCQPLQGPAASSRRTRSCSGRVGGEKVWAPLSLSRGVAGVVNRTGSGE